MMGKINTNKFDQIETARANRGAEAAPSKRSAETRSSTPVESGDRMEFSGRASLVGRAMDAIREIPDVREDVVGELREKIASGTYAPTGEQIADAIMKDESA